MDTTENEAKEKTRFTDKNFTHVINAEIQKAPIDVLIVQAGSVDITNMKTNNQNLKKYGEYLKQQAIVSASNLFTSVSNALNSNQKIQKAIILKQTPRYDPTSADPQSTKAALAQLYNDTLDQLYLCSSLKNKICIGSHDLECSGGVRYSRYRKIGKYDGLHFYGSSGRKAYTESVLNILRSIGNMLFSPPNYFRRYHNTESQTKPSNQSNLTCPTQESDWMNDQNIRYKKNVQFQ